MGTVGRRDNKMKQRISELEQLLEAQVCLMFVQCRVTCVDCVQ
jgi:hypothetical protein